ncbi:hypothetical protein MRX96_040595 [Rhipicephalus microplus]
MRRVQQQQQCNQTTAPHTTRRLVRALGSRATPARETGRWICDSGKGSDEFFRDDGRRARTHTTDGASAVSTYRHRCCVRACMYIPTQRGRPTWGSGLAATRSQRPRFARTRAGGHRQESEKERGDSVARHKSLQFTLMRLGKTRGREKRSSTQACKGEAAATGFVFSL